MTRDMINQYSYAKQKLIVTIESLATDPKLKLSMSSENQRTKAEAILMVVTDCVASFTNVSSILLI